MTIVVPHQSRSRCRSERYRKHFSSRSRKPSHEYFESSMVPLWNEIIHQPRTAAVGHLLVEENVYEVFHLNCS